MNDKRLELCKDVWEQHHNGGLTYAEIARRKNWFHSDGTPQRGKVARMVADYATKARIESNVIEDSPPTLLEEVQQLRHAYAELKASITTRRSNLLVLVPDANQYDFDQWQQTKSDLRTNKGYIKLSHLSDLHKGDNDLDADEMNYRMVEINQPDVIVVGSDTADFSLISHFAPDPDDFEVVQDVIDDFSKFWQAHIDRLNLISPRSKLVFIYGNHEIRIHDWVAENAPKFRKTINRAWVEAVQYGGKVMYVGRTQELEIGNLLVKHGDVTSQNTSKALLDRVSYQMSVMAGHIHRVTSFTQQGRHYMVSAITAGCAQSLNPRYVKKKGLVPPRPWVHGTAFATVDMKSNYVSFENIVYQREFNKLIAITNGQIVERTITFDEQKAA